MRTLAQLPGSIQGRLLALVLGLVLIVWSGTITWSSLEAQHELDDLLDSHLAQAAALLVVQQASDFDEDDTITPETPALHHYAPRVAFQVIHEGRMTLRSANAPLAPMRPVDRPFQRGFTTLTLDGTTWRVFAAYGAEWDVQVYVGESVDSRHAILRAALRGLVVPMLLALPVLALALWWAVRQGVRPLGRLQRTLEAREPQQLTALPTRGLPAELQPLVEALNRLFGRIALMLQSERRFTADAAHELRTPIAAIRAQAQVALQADSDATRGAALRRTLQGCDRATRLVEQLLTLSRLEGSARPDRHRLDLRRLVERAMAELAPQALVQGQRLELDIDDGREPLLDEDDLALPTPSRPLPLADHPEDWAVQGSDALIGVMVRNLVDNALRYGGPAVRVRVTVWPAAGLLQGPAIVVEDSGAGMSAAHLTRLGERFFRVPGHDQPGSGLGWSIVRRIAEVHQARWDADTSPELGGLRVRVIFPPMAATAPPDPTSAAGAAGSAAAAGAARSDTAPASPGDRMGRH